MKKIFAQQNSKTDPPQKSPPGPGSPGRPNSPPSGGGRPNDEGKGNAPRRHHVEPSKPWPRR